MSIDSKRYRCQGADKIIAVLNKLKTPQQAMSLPELLEEVNKNIPLRKNKLNYTNIRRLVRNVEGNEIDTHKLGQFQDKNNRNTIKYYVLNSKVIKKDSGRVSISGRVKKSDNKKQKNIQKTVLVSKKSAITKTEKNDEKSHYPRILDFLKKNNNFNEESFLFKVWGEKRSNGKWQNPDLLGVNTRSEGNQHKVISVEVKIDTSETQILVGIAQCCIYRSFSEYVLFFCRIDQEKQRDLFDKVQSICNFYGIGLIVNDENKYTIFPKATVELNRYIQITRRLVEDFHK
jgi:hypothetical protein